MYHNWMPDLAKNKIGIKNRKCRMMLQFLKKKNQMWWYKYTTASALVRCSKLQVGSIKDSVTMGKAVSKQTWKSERWNSLPQIMQPPRSLISNVIQVTVKVWWDQGFLCVCVCVVLHLFLILLTIETNGTRFLKFCLTGLLQTAI